MRLSESWMQFIKFGIVGVANTVIGIGSYYLLLWLGCHYLVANVGSWGISVFNAFYWNNKYVFKSNAIWWRALIKTYISYGASFVSGTVLLYLLVEWCGVSELLAPVCTLLLTIPMNFLLNSVLIPCYNEVEEDEIVINFNRVIKRGWEHFDNAVICALRMLSRMNAKNVFLAGFDGFKEQYNESYADADLPALNVSNKWEALNAEIRDMYSDVKLSVGEKIKIKFLTNSVFEL